MADYCFFPERPVRVARSPEVHPGVPRHDAPGNLNPAAYRPDVGQHTAPQQSLTRSDIRGVDGDVA